ncbi:MAG: tetratricopeptide repeat protein [Alphaproteobacteria bacterium]|nr:tetratricopeptide repeat protein [Alphaproteobacteria bacterium]
MSDFVEEVEENLRAERLAQVFRRVWPWFAAALTATIVGWLGAWAWQSWQNQNIARASVVYDQAMTALDGGDQAGASKLLAPLAKDGPAGYRTLALMTQADIDLSAGKAADAASLFDQAAKSAPNPVFHDLAALRAAQSLMDTAPLAQISVRLTPLIGANKPFDLQAREALAIAKLAAGQVRQARDDLNALSLSLGISQTMRTRDEGVIALIDSGQGARVAQVVQAAAHLPPGAEMEAMKLLAASAPPQGQAAPSEAGSPAAPAGAPPSSPSAP